eukprot:m.651376 g.651376  ORF g.651376 m.651376 type:complete len:137 (-) comp22675_c0_seq3:664-1074(-)
MYVTSSNSGAPPTKNRRILPVMCFPTGRHVSTSTSCTVWFMRNQNADPDRHTKATSHNGRGKPNTSFARRYVHTRRHRHPDVAIALGSVACEEIQRVDLQQQSWAAHCVIVLASKVKLKGVAEQGRISHASSITYF